MPELDTNSPSFRKYQAVVKPNKRANTKGTQNSTIGMLSLTLFYLISLLISISRLASDLFGPDTQKAIAAQGRAAANEAGLYGRPTIEYLRQMESEAKSEVANITFRIQQSLFLRNQALRALDKATEALAEAEKDVAQVTQSTEVMTIDDW